MSALALPLALGLWLADPPSQGVEPVEPATAAAAKPARSRGRPRPVGELSQQGFVSPSGLKGTRRGALEFGLATVLTGSAIGLVAFGVVEFEHARAQREFCSDPLATVGGGLDSCTFDSPTLGFTSAGLAWGFAVPLSVGAGLLFARGARVLADARRFSAGSDRSLRRRPSRWTLAPWWTPRSSGVTFGLRF